MEHTIFNHATGETATVEGDSPEDALEYWIAENYTPEVAAMLSRDEFSVEPAE